MAIYKTSDNSKDKRLVTNWFINDYKECILAVKKVCLNFGYTLKYESEEYGELIFTRKRDTLDVRIISLTRRETAIDFVINSKIYFDFGRSKTVIEDLYERLRRELKILKRWEKKVFG